MIRIYYYGLGKEKYFSDERVFLFENNSLGKNYVLIR